MIEYYLKNKNKKLLLFTVKYDSFSQEYCEEIERYVELPELPPSFIDIESWIERRNYAKHKEHLAHWLKEWNLNTISGFIDITHGLGLNDTLWISPANSSLTWEAVNLYTNDFTDVVSKTAFSRGLHGLKLSSTSPEFTSEGSFEKCWVRENDGHIYLYKKGSSGFANSGLEAYSEFYSTQYSSVLCKSYVNYDLIKFKGSLVSRCQMFTSENEGFIPIYKYLDNAKSHRFQEIIDFLSKYGFEEDFKDMILLDSVIMNPDRHLGNFGFIVDNETFEIKRFAPVFDHNMALLARGMNDDLEINSFYIQEMGHKIGADFIPAGRAMLTSRTKKLLQQLRDVPIYPHKLYNLHEKRVAMLEKLIHYQINEILQ